MWGYHIEGGPLSWHIGAVHCIASLSIGFPVNVPSNCWYQRYAPRKKKNLECAIIVEMCSHSPFQSFQPNICQLSFTPCSYSVIVIVIILNTSHSSYSHNPSG